MGGLFGGGSPSPPSLPALPAANDTTAQEAADRERKRAQAAAGRASTVATSGSGLTDAAPTAKKTLLGSA